MFLCSECMQCLSYFFLIAYRTSVCVCDCKCVCVCVCVCVYLYVFTREKICACLYIRTHA